MRKDLHTNHSEHKGESRGREFSRAETTGDENGDSLDGVLEDIG